MEEKKVLLLVNKDFEYAGYRAGVEYQMTAGKTPNVTLVKRDTRTGPNKYDPSCIYDITQGQHKFNVREYCISYLFNEGENTSNSEIKFGHLKKLISAEKPDFVISVSVITILFNIFLFAFNSPFINLIRHRVIKDI